MATVASVIDELSSELGEIGGDADTEYVFLNWIKDTIADILLSGEWFFVASSFNLETDSGVSVYNMPTDLGDIKAIQRDDTGQKLVYTRIESLAKATEKIGGTDTGAPVYWLYHTMDGGVVKIRLYPTPDAAYDLTIYYEKADPALTAVSDTIPLPPDFIPVLKDKVRYLYYTQVGHEGATAFLSSFLNGLNRLRNRYEHPRDEITRHGYNDLPDDSGGFPTPQLPATYPRIL